MTTSSFGLRITGDRAGLREFYIHCAGSAGAVATDLGELLNHLHDERVETCFDNFGISSLLHHALVPLPHTEFSDIHVLSMGDAADIGVGDGSLTVQLSHEYPWTVDRSRNDGVPSEATLLRLLTAATERQLAAANNDGFLMLSSGKDSVGVALALAEAGFNHIRCVTYSSGPNDPEPPLAAAICQRLGLPHEIVEMPTDPGETAAILTRFFEASARAGVDLSQIPYALTTAAAASGPGAILDGGGNDSFMGYPAAGHDLDKLRYRIRGRRLAAAVGRLVPVDSGFNYLARSRGGATLPGRTMRLAESRRLYPGAVDTDDYWYRLSKDTRQLDALDLYGAVNERHTGPGGSMQKQRLAAAALNMGAALPWCDDDVAEYYFNLPEAARYSRKPVKGKLLLRTMLLRYLGYDADVIGKHYFSFDGAGFIHRNLDFVRDEIDSCALWDKGGLSLVGGWLDQLEDRPLLYHVLLTIFMVSGWHNHSRYVGAIPSPNDEAVS